MLRARAVVFLALVLCAAASPVDRSDADYVTDFDNVKGWNWTWLNKLMKNVKVPIPDQSLEAAGFSIKIKRISCEGFRIGSLGMANRGTSFRVTTANTQLSCNAHFSYHQSTIRFPFGSASVDVAVSEIAIGLTVDLSTDSNNLPVAATIEECSTSAKADVDFHGLITGNILSLFSGRVERTIESAVASELCKGVASTVKNHLNPALQNAANNMQPFVVPASPTPLPPLPAEEELLDWEDSSLLNVIRNVTGRLGPEGVNAIVNRLIDPATGSLVSPMGQSFNMESEYMDLKLKLNTIEVRGLNSMTVFEPVRSTAPLQLGSAFHVDEIGVTIHTDMELTNHLDTQGTQVIKSPVTLGLSLTDLRLETSALVAVYADYINRIESVAVDNVLQPGCWTEILAAVAITQLSLTYDKGPDVEVLGFDKSFSSSATNLVMMAVRLMQPALPNIVKTVLGGQVRELANGAMNNTLTNLDCIPSLISGEFVDLREFMPLAKLNEAVSATSVDALIGATSGGQIRVPTLLDTQVIDDDGAELRVSIENFVVGGLNSFTSLRLWVPISADTLESNITIGQDSNPLSVAGSVFIQYKDRSDGSEVTEAHRFGLSMVGLSLFQKMRILIRSREYHNLSIGDLRYSQRILGIFDTVERVVLEPTAERAWLTYKNLTGPTAAVPFYDIVNTAVLDAVIQRLPEIIASAVGAPPRPDTRSSDSHKASTSDDSNSGTTAIIVSVCVGAVCAVLGVVGGITYERRRSAANHHSVVRPVKRPVVPSPPHQDLRAQLLNNKQ